MWKDLAAALTFFTRLPFYKLKAFNVPTKHYKQAINYWPVVGWLTGGVMALTLSLTTLFLPSSLAILLAMVSRLLLTGALHEDGLSDFFDGLGGGTTRQRVLEIMKDSHIGVYGVISLITYFLILYQSLSHLDLYCLPLIMIAADSVAKLIASHIHRVLPYARTEATSKAKLVYEQVSPSTYLLALVFGLLPLFYLAYHSSWIYLCAVLPPILVFILIWRLLKRRIQGYTGDCCGAIFLLCELTFYLSLLTLTSLSL